MRTAGPNQPVQLLLDVLDLILELGIPHAIIGAFSVSFHGVPRATKDADAVIWLDHTGRTDRDIKEHLVAAGYQVRVRKGDRDDPIQKAIVVRDAHENSVDLLIGVRGMDPKARDRCVSAVIMKSTVRIIGGEDLIAMIDWQWFRESSALVSYYAQTPLDQE